MSVSVNLKKRSMLNDQEDSSTGCTPPKVKNVLMDQNTENVESKICGIAFQSNDWHGVPLENLKISDVKDVYPPVIPSETHTVLFKLPVLPNQPPEPYPEKPVDVWDKDYVRLPCSSHCLSPVSEVDLRKRWDLICEAYSKPIKSSQQLEEAILHYNSKYVGRWSFGILHYFFSTTLLEEETEHFFTSIFPSIVRLALSLPQQLTGGIPLLRQKKTHSLSLTQKQIACLLANAFLCTFPRRNTSKPTSEYKNYPDINFNRLYTFGAGDHVQEKLKCIINYFRRVCSNCPAGVVTYSRHYVSPNSLPVWSESKSEMPLLHVTSVGTIEDRGAGMMELDFANKMVGGGVLRRGCVQEEIRFVISPELIVARLFTECLDDTEALIISGVERYSRHKGYSSSFTWTGDYVDKTPRDQYGRRFCVVVAVDATHFQQAEKQFTMESINRELNKVYAGFSWGIQSRKDPKLSVATGNWGCGAFRGNAQLKALLQLMAASVAGRNIAYFTFEDSELCDKIGAMHKFLTQNNITVCHLWKLLSKYQNIRGHSKKDRNVDLYDFIYNSITGKVGTYCSTSTFFSSIKKVEPKPPETQMDVSDVSSHSGLNTHQIDEVLANIEDDIFTHLSGKEPDKQVRCIENSSSGPEPAAAKAYDVTSKEGRDKCLQRQRDSWARIEESKKDFNEFEIIDDDSISSDTDNSKTKSSSSFADSKNSNKTSNVKRKISDYFPTTSKV